MQVLTEECLTLIKAVTLCVLTLSSAIPALQTGQTLHTF